MRVLLIVNATASSFSARKRVVIQKALGADHEVEVVETVRGGHALRLARGAAAEGVDVVAVLGGDGTLNEAANGLMGTDTALAALPGGSTNVYARSIGVADDAIDATGQLLAALERRSLRRVGLGKVGDRHFLFHCGVGFDAAVVERVEARSAIKRYAAHPVFGLTALDTWLRTFDHSRGRFVVHLADGSTIDGGVMAIVAKTTPYTYVGHRPIIVTPNAGLGTPLSLAVVRTHHALPMLALAGTAILGKRGVARQPGVTVRDGLEQLTIVADEPIPYQVDGEFLGTSNRLVFSHQPDCLTLVVPAR